MDLEDKKKRQAKYNMTYQKKSDKYKNYRRNYMNTRRLDKMKELFKKSELKITKNGKELLDDCKTCKDYKEIIIKIFGRDVYKKYFSGKFN